MPTNRRFPPPSSVEDNAAYIPKDSPDTRAASDFVGVNFDSNYAAFLVKERQLT